MCSSDRLRASTTHRRRSLELTTAALVRASGLHYKTLRNWDSQVNDPMIPPYCAYPLAVGLRLAVVDLTTQATLSSTPDLLLAAAAAWRRERGVPLASVAAGMTSSTSHVQLIESGAIRPRLSTACRYLHSVDAALHLVLVYDRPACCTCDPYHCRADSTGEHCATQSCAHCLHGCPAPEGECCPPAALEAAS